MTNELQQHLAEKIAGLAPDARRAVYDKAREALQSDVRAAAPFMPVQTVVARRRELESAIIAVEKEAARSDHLRPPAPPAPPPPAPAAMEPTPPAAVASAESVQPAQEARNERSPDETPAIPADPPLDAARLQAETLAALMEKPLVPAKPASPARPRTPSFPYEPAPPPESENVIDEEIGEFIAAQKSRHSTAIYLAVVAIVLCAAALAAVLMSFAFEPASGRGAEAARPAPVVLPRPTTPEAKLIDGAGFRSAAQQALKEGNTFLARRDYARAISAFDDALRFEADNATALGNRAFAHFATGNIQAAIRDYGAAIDREPANLEFRFNRAIALNKAGEHRRAVDDLDRVLAANPANVDALNGRCWARAVLAHLEEALADCNEAVKRRPQDAEVYDSRGFVLLRLGRLDRAVADYSEALRIQPRHAGALYGRGLAKIGRGDRAGGQEDVAAARAIDPDIAATFARYGIR